MRILFAIAHYCQFLDKTALYASLKTQSEIRLNNLSNCIASLYQTFSPFFNADEIDGTSGLRGTLKENGARTKRSELKLKQKSEKEQQKKRNKRQSNNQSSVHHRAELLVCIASAQITSYVAAQRWLPFTTTNDRRPGDTAPLFTYVYMYIHPSIHCIYNIV